MKALRIGKASRIIKSSDNMLTRCNTAGRMRLVIGILPDVNARGFHSSLLMGARKKINDDLICSERTNLLRAANPGRSRNLDEPCRMQFFNMCSNSTVRDIKPLGKIGKIQLFVLQQLLQDAETHIRIQRLI